MKIGFSSLFFREFLCGRSAKETRWRLCSVLLCIIGVGIRIQLEYHVARHARVVSCGVGTGAARARRKGAAFCIQSDAHAVDELLHSFWCVFLFFYYFVLRVQFKRSLSRHEKESHWYEPLIAFGKFAGFAVLSALLAGVVLWPTAKALAITSAANDAFPEALRSHRLLDTLGRMTPLRSPNIMSGLPNIYAGMAALLMLPAFFADKRPRTVRSHTVRYSRFCFLLSISHAEFLVARSPLPELA